MASIHIKNGRIIDPSQNLDEVKSIFIQNKKIADRPSENESIIIDAAGMWVVPGLVDAHVHLRQPGQEHKETFATGLAAAAAGGFTTVISMPNTAPAADCVKEIEYIASTAALLAGTKVRPASAITIGRAGQKLVDMAALAAAGVTAFTDDGDGVQDDKTMELALFKGAQLGVVLAQHSEFKTISKGGAVHEGAVSKELGISGWPLSAEEKMIERDIELVKKTGGRLHVSHISSKGSVELVRQAKKEGLPVTAEVTPHHLYLTDQILKDGNTNAKVCPPLRPQKHVDACREGLRDGTIDIVATDHAPHTVRDKQGGFEKAAFGMVGLEISVSIMLKLVNDNVISPIQMIRAMSTQVAEIFNLNAGTLKTGAVADVTIINPANSFKINTANFLSKGRNTPFENYPVPGKPVTTIVDGKIVFDIL